MRASIASGGLRVAEAPVPAVRAEGYGKNNEGVSFTSGRASGADRAKTPVSPFERTPCRRGRNPPPSSFAPAMHAYPLSGPATPMVFLNLSRIFWSLGSCLDHMVRSFPASEPDFSPIEECRRLLHCYSIAKPFRAPGKTEKRLLRGADSREPHWGGSRPAARSALDEFPTFAESQAGRLFACQFATEERPCGATAGLLQGRRKEEP